MIHPSVYLVDPFVQPVYCYVYGKLVPPYLSLCQITKMTGLIEHDGTQHPCILHGHLQNGISLFLTHVSTNDTILESGMLVTI